jgi:hypothetical protein
MRKYHREGMRGKKYLKQFYRGKIPKRGDGTDGGKCLYYLGLLENENSKRFIYLMKGEPHGNHSIRMRGCQQKFSFKKTTPRLNTGRI